MAEILGRTGHIGSEAMNCSAPDTGNMGSPLDLFKRELWAYWISRGFCQVWLA
jgi:hypothetical protein